MSPKTIKQFREVLSQTTGYYYTDDRIEYLLERISREATDLTHYLDQLTIEESNQVDAMNLRQRLKHDET